MRAEVAELLAEINDKNDALQRKDDALTRMNADLQASDARVSELRETVERLNRQITVLGNATKVDVVAADPTSESTRKAAKDAQETLQTITEELQRSKEELRSVETVRDQIQEEVAQLKAESEKSRRERSVLNAFNQELASLKAKWTSAFFSHSGTDVSPETKEKLSEAAAELRMLADQLDAVCS